MADLISTTILSLIQAGDCQFHPLNPVITLWNSQPTFLPVSLAHTMAIRPLARRGMWAEVADFMLDLDDVPSPSWRWRQALVRVGRFDVERMAVRALLAWKDRETTGIAVAQTPKKASCKKRCTVSKWTQTPATTTSGRLRRWRRR